jgi:hypothetical protein
LVVLTAFDIKNRQQLVLNVAIPFDAPTVTGFLGQFPAGARMVFVPNIVLRALDRIFECIMGLQDFVEAQTITGVLIVGMVTPSKITTYPVYRFRVGVWADLQNFVIVGERRGSNIIVHKYPQAEKLNVFATALSHTLSVLLVISCRFVG